MGDPRPDAARSLNALERAVGLAVEDGFRRARSIQGLDHLASRAAAALEGRGGARETEMARFLRAALPAGYARASVRHRKKALACVADGLRAWADGSTAPELPTTPFYPIAGNLDDVETAKGRSGAGSRSSPPVVLLPGDAVGRLRGVGPRLGSLLEGLGLATLLDLATARPRTYRDERYVNRVGELHPDQPARLVGQIVKARCRRGGRGMFLSATFDDGTGPLGLVWFRAPRYLQQQVQSGRLVVVSGTPTRDRSGQLQIAHPVCEFVDELREHEPMDAQALQEAWPEWAEEHRGGIVPIYASTEGLGQKTLRRLIEVSVGVCCAKAEEWVPPALLAGADALSLRALLPLLHAPPRDADVDALESGDSAVHRGLLLHDLFVGQVGLAMRRMEVAAVAVEPLPLRPALHDPVVEGLGFTLTGAQNRVLGEIREDMARGSPMRRLLQGDVGSGKTVVAVLSALGALEAGKQVAVLAPTTILAEQHLASFQRWLGPHGVRSELLIGSLRARERRSVEEGAACGLVQVVCGTHALLQERLSFKNLGLVIADEQHRFGVAQRAALVGKGEAVHLLAMTATPIPRSLALTLYGDLEISVLDESPRRGPRTTQVVGEAGREGVYREIRAAVDRGERAYVICPLVEEREGSSGRDAAGTADELRNGFLAGLSVGLLHGRMLPGEKAEAIESFRSGVSPVLVSTTVVEVGVDVPEATVLVVEGAQRFGLSQLHQLRGRVGRSSLSSKVFLVRATDGEGGGERLATLASTEDGFRIAEEDLAQRGPGDLIGRRQSGRAAYDMMMAPGFSRLLSLCRAEARRTVEADGFGESAQTQALRREVARRVDLRAGADAG